ncbi:MAG: GntR family transcriptional regulator [Bifidobacteriaceae bacterium]|jgi:DNA-binding transcriptional regulator YhcF (GntR family)|nr:GntR family transcriptional regulator [Bifidobacteriaceae bacterium]
MIVRLDPASAVPLFEQLRSQIERLIVSEQLTPGTQLPAIRHLATDLGLARGTVAKVYEQLVRDGLVVSARRAGTVVAPRPEPKAASAIDPTASQAMNEAAAHLAVVTKQLGLAADAAQAALTRAWAALETP